jgi:hypothetical protein
MKQPKWRGINTGDRNRARMHYTGMTDDGRKLWTPEEEDVVRTLYPDRTKIAEILDHRTPGAIRHRIGSLGLAKPRRAWTTNEILKLRRLYRDATKAELVAELPRHPWQTIRCKGPELGLRRNPWRPKPTGNKMIDQIRLRAAALRISLSDLDRICATRGWFTQSSQGFEPRRNIYFRAIAALGGRVEIVWR